VTTPRNSIHGPPRDDSTDGPTAGGGSSDSPAPSYVPDPYLQVIWGDAPAITGNVGGNAGAGGTPNEHPMFTVDLGSIREAENGILGQTRSAVANYMNLKNLVEQAIDGGSVWGQQATMTVEHPTSTAYEGVSEGGPGPSIPDTIEPDTDIQQVAQQYAAVMDPAMSEVLRQCADAIESVGQFVVLLDRAGQQYAYADKTSFFPDPPPATVTTS